MQLKAKLAYKKGGIIIVMTLPLARGGFRGFGEAAYRLAKGLRAAGLKGVVTYDKFQDTFPYNKVIQARIKDARVKVVSDVQKLG